MLQNVMKLTWRVPFSYLKILSIRLMLWGTRIDSRQRVNYWMTCRRIWLQSCVGPHLTLSRHGIKCVNDVVNNSTMLAVIDQLVRPRVLIKEDRSMLKSPKGKRIKTKHNRLRKKYKMCWQCIYYWSIFHITISQFYI